MAIIVGSETTGNDFIIADGANDSIRPLQGNDTVYGGAGNDLIFSYTGNDSLIGGQGNGGHKRVLVVDDSITVREVERKLLQNRGYTVEVAVDGMEGWNAIRS